MCLVVLRVSVEQCKNSSEPPVLPLWKQKALLLLQERILLDSLTEMESALKIAGCGAEILDSHFPPWKTLQSRAARAHQVRVCSALGFGGGTS